MKTYHPHPKQEIFHKCAANEILYGGAAGPGKATSLDAEIITPFGVKTMADMRVGSQISNPDGSISRVIQIHPQGVQRLYRVSFADGSSVECTKDHLWLWKRASVRRFRKKPKSNNFPDYRISTTAILIQYLNKQKAAKMLGKRPYWPLIPLSEPTEFTPPAGRWEHYRRNQIDPYTLGVLLGDGSITQKTVTFTVGDKFIVDTVKGVGFDQVGKLKGESRYSIIGGETATALKRYGLMGLRAEHKFIPEEYRIAPLDVRLEIIRGLMDTDGTVDHRGGWCSFTTVSRYLANNVRWIIQSLGGRASITKRIPKYEYNEEIREGQLAYTLHIQTENDAELFNLPRKIDLCVDGFNGGVSNLGRRMVDISYSRDAEAQCITVDNPNGLYLTDDFIVTHNSHALRHEGLTWCMRIPGLHVYLFRRTFPDLEKNHIIPSLEEFPQDIGKYRDQKKRWEFKNGSMLHFCHAQYEKDVFHYQGAEIHILLIDELTSFTDFMYDYLRGRTRCTLNIPKKYKHKIPGVYCGSNPGGIGHEFVKMRWVDPDPFKEMKLFRAPKKEGGMLRCYIPGLLKDNPSLTENDPGYEDRLDGLPEPYRTAYKEGDWDIFMGQAFNFGSRHLIKPIVIPEFSPLYLTFDWGFGAPFSVGFWWVDPDNRLYRFSEWYGWNGVPNQGLRLTDEQIGEGIRKRKENLSIKEIIEIADPTCFNKKPDYKGGGQGPSTAEIFKNYGITLRPGDPKRDLKLRQFHSRLRIPEDENELPMLVVYDTCEEFRRTIPLLQTDPLNIEDIDTSMEDHIYDEAALICMARPMGADDGKVKQIIKERAEKAKLAELDPVSRRFWEKDFAVWKQGVLDQEEYERTGGMW